LIDPKWMRVENLPRQYAAESIRQAREIFNKLDDDYPNLQYNRSLFENITDTLKDKIPQERAESFFERVDYTNGVYQKKYPTWDFYKQFPFLAEYKNEYGIK
jgi:hypothetical protein